MNAVAYLRVSSKEQAEGGYSIEAQRLAVARHAEERGMTLVGEFVDLAESARSADRPQLKAMLTLIADDRSVNALIVHRLDRLARSLEDHTTIRATLRKNSVRLVSVTENIEENASGRLIEGVMASIAQWYSENLGQEIAKGQTQKAREGLWPTAAPTGYRNVRTSNGKRKAESVLVVDDEQAPLVLQAFQSYANGMSLNELQPEMAKRGLKNRYGTPMQRASLAEMLQNRIYIGKVVWRDIEYEGVHEPIVPLVLFEKVQRRLRLQHVSGNKRFVHNHYLRGVLRCTCGGRLCTMHAKKKYLYFFCLNRQRRKCKQPYVLASDLEEQVERLYERVSLPDDLKTLLRKQLEDEIAERERGRSKIARTLSKRLEQLAAQKEKLLRAYYAEAIDVETLKREQDRINAETAHAEQDMQHASQHFQEARELVDVALALADNMARSYKAASPDVRERYNAAFFKKLVVEDGKIIRAEWGEPFSALFSFAGGSRAVRLAPSARCANYNGVATGEPRRRDSEVAPYARRTVEWI